jgi:hypothetical protein
MVMSIFVDGLSEISDSFQQVAYRLVSFYSFDSVVEFRNVLVSGFDYRFMWHAC